VIDTPRCRSSCRANPLAERIGRYPKCAADPDGGESTRREQAIGGGAADGESVGCLVRLQQKSLPEHLRLTKATQNLDQPYADRIMSKSSLGTI